MTRGLAAAVDRAIEEAPEGPMLFVVVGVAEDHAPGSGEEGVRRTVEIEPASPFAAAFLRNVQSIGASIDPLIRGLKEVPHEVGFVLRLEVAGAVEGGRPGNEAFRGGKIAVAARRPTPAEAISARRYLASAIPAPGAGR